MELEANSYQEMEFVWNDDAERNVKSFAMHVNLISGKTETSFNCTALMLYQVYSFLLGSRKKIDGVLQSTGTNVQGFSR